MLPQSGARSPDVMSRSITRIVSPGKSGLIPSGIAFRSRLISKRSEVTVGAWRAWLAVRAQGPSGPGRPPGAPDAATPATFPMTRVTFRDAVRYAEEARGGRLPRVEEFERAVRGSGLST